WHDAVQRAADAESGVLPGAWASDSHPPARGPGGARRTERADAAAVARHRPADRLAAARPAADERRGRHAEGGDDGHLRPRGSDGGGPVEARQGDSEPAVGRYAGLAAR